MKNKYCNAKNIKAELDGYVMGQEQGTKMIAMAIAQHLLKSQNPSQRPYRRTDNVLLIGPTGCGKTETFRVLQKLETDFGCPVLMFNILDYAATKTWQGDSITAIFLKVFEEAGKIFDKLNDGEVTPDERKEGVVEIANRAIILFDEIDKIALDGDGKSRQFLKEYQSNLLKIVEGNTYDVGTFTYDNGSDTPCEINDIVLDTTNMMFIMLGAFDGIEDITRYRLYREEITKKPEKQNPAHTVYQDTRIGFMAPQESHETQEPQTEEYTYEQLIPTQEDVIQYGFMRELVGRIAVRTVYKPLSEAALVDILLHAKTSAYREWQDNFEQNGHGLACDRAALREIAQISIERGTGARGLSNVFSELLMPTLYELSGNDHFIRCLLRGKEIRAHKAPLLHDREPHIKKRRERILKHYKKFMGKCFPKKAT
ncbi:MAG: AAA family ATPase [Acidaminococcaceae bacterium]|nr:AAA family ATPase [Acidaminococcaceae bacterium]